MLSFYLVRHQSTSKRKDMIVTLRSREAEIQQLKSDVTRLEAFEVESKKLNFAFHNLEKEHARLVKRNDRTEKDAEKWKSQVQDALNLVEQLQDDFNIFKHDAFLTEKRLKKRLVVKALWFRTSLIKLERLTQLCLEIDSYLKPELICPHCLNILKHPQT